MSKNVLVIGGSGFLGSHVCDILTNTGFKVTIFDKEKSKWIKKNQKFEKGDILDQKKIEQVIKKNSIVFNFAGVSDLDEGYYNPIDVTKYNILANNYILSSCIKYKIKKYIFSSTVYVNGKYGGFYKTSKKCCELFIKNYSENYNLDYLILQFGTLYGPRSDIKNGIYRYLLQATKYGKIDYYGSKDSIRSYINVIDAAKVCVKLLSQDEKNKTFIITGSQERKITDTFKLIEEIIGKKIKITFKKPKQNNHYNSTPYSYDNEITFKYSVNKSVDFGYGIIKLIQELKNNERKDKKNNNI